MSRIYQQALAAALAVSSLGAQASLKPVNSPDGAMVGDSSLNVTWLQDMNTLRGLNASAVRTGDVTAAVPDPKSYAMLLAGIGMPAVAPRLRPRCGFDTWVTLARCPLAVGSSPTTMGRGALKKPGANRCARDGPNGRPQQAAATLG